MGSPPFFIGARAAPLIP